MTIVVCPSTNRHPCTNRGMCQSCVEAECDRLRDDLGQIAAMTDVALPAVQAVEALCAARDRLREALERIAATEASMTRGERWVHWREQASRALALSEKDT